MTERLYVLVGGWPGSGKSTLAAALAPRLGLALLSKDDVKLAIADALGDPADVRRSQQLGRAAVHAVLAVARTCPGAVVDSTWFDYARPLAEALPGRCVEVRCVVPRDVARQRYADRRRDARHLDADRDPAELWGTPVAPLGVGPLVEVHTVGPVDLTALVARVRDAAGG